MLEPAVIQEKLSNRGLFPVIYCPEIKGSKIPLVSNLFGSYTMLGMALGIESRMSATDIEERPYFAFGDRGAQLVDRERLVREMSEKLGDKKPPQTVPASEAPVKEVILKGKDVDLGILPMTKHGARDSTKYITAGCMISKDPTTGIPNVGIYRHELKGKNKLGLAAFSAHHIAYISRHYAEMGKRMEVAIFIGHHPTVVLGSMTKGDIDMNELEVMGGLLGEPLLMTPAETVDLEVPAWAEIVIEGTVDTTHIDADGPFAEYSGYYGERGGRTVYVMDVTAITMRKDAIYQDLDPAHREHNLLSALFFESAVFDQVKRVVPTLKAVNVPLSASAAFHIYLSIKKRIQGEGKWAGMAALLSDPYTKMAIVVDEDVDVYDEQEVLWAIATRVNAAKDIQVLPWVAGSEYDPTSYDETATGRGNMTTKVIIDATKPVGIDFQIRCAPPEELWKSLKLSDYIDLP